MKQSRARVLFRNGHKGKVVIVALILCSLLIVDAGCFLRGVSSSAYYGRVVVPRAQEFRWSDGGLPQVFDPAFAAAPPDTDAVRALFEGLTDYDPQSLQPVPAVATRWESTDDSRVWTFYLRSDARWSTGVPVTAQDFVRSWQRTLKLGEQAPHTELLSNIVGARPAVRPTLPAAAPVKGRRSRHMAAADRRSNDAALNILPLPFGAEAINDHLLRVHLQAPNPDFPALVAHPVFRPVKIADEDAKKKIGATDLISNGAFLLGKTATDSVMLERADKYWGRSEVSLERVKFVGTRDPETALAAYRAGEIDAVTNAALEPLALKLLTPYEDYHRTVFGALTYYSFNTAHRPFDDVRVREALASAIDRERLSREEMGGATEPAHQFLPNALAATADRKDEAVVAKSATLNQDLNRARELLAEAGYPAGNNFPPVRLLINRNDQQRQVAEAIAAMWLANLNIETEIIVKSWDEYEAAIRNGEYDLARRGMVMQTTDEATNIRLLFADTKAVATQAGVTTHGSPAPEAGREAANVTSLNRELEKNAPVDSQAEALRQVSAIPVYFACSSTLLKPYVSGFDNNVLDAPSLKKVRIDSGWRAPIPAPGGRR